jgi:hypothetical protein
MYHTLTSICTTMLHLIKSYHVHTNLHHSFCYGWQGGMDTTASIYHENLNVMEAMTETESNMYTHSSCTCLTDLVKGGLLAHLYNLRMQSAACKSSIHHNRKTHNVIWVIDMVIS